jgi:hypothetical protein
LPPVVCWRGTRPSQARSRARANACPPSIAATSAVAISAPMPGGGHQQARARVRPGDEQDVLIEGGDLVIQHLPLHAQPVKERAHQGTELVSRLEHFGQGFGQRRAARRERDPALEQERPDLVDPRLAPSADHRRSARSGARCIA